MKLSTRAVLVRFLSFATALSAVAATSPCTDGWTILQTYNLFSAGDVWTSSDVEGTTFIGGGLVSSNSANFGIHLSSTTAVTLEIAGDIVSGNAVQVNKGSLAHQPGIISYLQNPNVGWKVNDRSFNINDGNSGAGASADSELSSKAATLKSAMEDLSAFLEALSTTGIVSLPGGNDQPTAANINIDAVDDANVAVLELDGNDFFDNNKIQQMEIKNNAGADLIIINVGGTSITWNEGNMVGSFLTGSTGRSKLIWNFYEATLVDFKSKNMMGTVVAPYAHVKSQANIDGATAVASFYSQSEVHFPLLSVDCPYTTPPKEGGGGGDPHIQRWGREHDSFHGECDLVMIHSNDFHQGAGLDLHIRTTIAPEDYYSYMETAALRVGDYAIEVYKDMLYINGVEHTASMLPITFGGDFRYTISQAPIEEGKKEELHQYYKVDLHEDSSVLFRFYKEYLTVNVSGHPNDFSDATGLLGEYHTGDMYSRAGDRMDDFNEYGFEWQVQPNQDGNLFTTARSPQWPYERCRMPTSARPARRQLRGQQSLLLTASLEACANAADVDLCVDDCLTTGDVGLAGLW